jgi:hypothetical protein
MDVQIACICPLKDGEARHEHDTVTLPDTLDFRRTLTVRQSIAWGMNGPVEQAALIALLIESYVLHCIDSWTCEDDKGKPLPLSSQNVRDYLLPQYDQAEAVGEAADSLYTEKVILPLLNRASSSLPPTPTPEPTSPTNGGGTTPRKPSKRSSTSTIPMVATGPMQSSPGGAYSS